jgi:hypothetical protein
MSRRLAPFWVVTLCAITLGVAVALQPLAAVAVAYLG